MNKIILACTITSILLAYPSIFEFAKDTLIIPEAQAAQADFYLKLEGVEGESTDSTHYGWIKIESFSFESHIARDSTTGLSTGKVSMSPFTVTKYFDKASPKLFEASATGEHFGLAEIVLVSSAGDFMRWTLQDCMVSSIQFSGTSDVLTESVSLNFNKIEMSYSPQKSDGTLDAPIKTGYDLGANKKV
ncbi:MAG: Hcp family type VI secretion system effector [Nitrosopumilaceae archaeon]